MPSRQQIGALGAHVSWSRTADRSARTANARRAFERRFELEVDPHGELDPAERERRAEHARKAYYQRLSLKAAQSRRQRAARRSDSGQVAS